MLAKLFEAFTGQPYRVGRSAAAEFGPLPAVEFAAELAGLSDAEVLRFGDSIVADARARRRTVPEAEWPASTAARIDVTYVNGRRR